MKAFINLLLICLILIQHIEFGLTYIVDESHGFSENDVHILGQIVDYIVSEDLDENARNQLVANLVQQNQLQAVTFYYNQNIAYNNNVHTHYVRMDGINDIAVTIVRRAAPAPAANGNGNANNGDNSRRASNSHATSTSSRPVRHSGRRR